MRKLSLKLGIVFLNIFIVLLIKNPKVLNAEKSSFHHDFPTMWSQYDHNMLTTSEKTLVESQRSLKLTDHVIGIRRKIIFSLTDKQKSEPVVTKAILIYYNQQRIILPLWKRSVDHNRQLDYTIIYKQKPPKIVLKLKNMKVLRDDQAIFICAIDGNPSPKIRWRINQSFTLPKRFSVTKISPKKSLLRINPVKLDDNKTRITCLAQNSLGSTDSYASLSVYANKQEIPSGFPTIISKSSVIVNEKNTKVILECKVQGVPTLTIFWLKDSIPIDFENQRINTSKNGNLEIIRTQEDDEGGYECVATNNLGTVVSSVIRLMIRENVEETYQLLLKDVKYFSPNFIKVSGDQIVTPGSSVTLKCRALGNPIPEVYWQCGQTILQSQSKNLTGQRAEANVILSDLSESLKCICVAKNIKESISRSISVTIQEPSTVPTAIRVTYIGPNSCNISWNQKPIREEYLKYKVFVMKTKDFLVNKNLTSGTIINVKKSDYEFVKTKSLQNLLPFTNYTVWLESFSMQTDSIKSNLVTFTTSELPPYTPPKNVELGSISNGAVLITWDPPDIPNGIITTYNIYYTQFKDKPLSSWDKYTVKSSKKSDSPQQTTILSYMANNTTYYISISAQNSAGSSPVSEPLAILIRPGVVQGPKSFRAIAKSSTEIELFWDSLPSKSQVNIIYYYLVYMPRSMPHLKKEKRFDYSPQKNTILIGSLQPNTTYEFQLSTITHTANGMPSFVECTTTPKACPMIVKNWDLSISKRGGIEICWREIPEKNSKINIRIYFQSKLGNFSVQPSLQTIGSKMCYQQLKEIKQNMNYKVLIVHKKRNCKTPIEHSDQIFTKSSVFIEDPIEVHTRAVNSTAIEVFWQTNSNKSKEAEHYRIQLHGYFPNRENHNKPLKDIYIKKTMSNSESQNITMRYIFANLAPDSEYQIYLNSITRERQGMTFKSEPIKTWPKKLPKPKFIHLRLSCSIENPCVTVEWKEDIKNKKWIKGYRLRYYPLVENDEIKYKVLERNVSESKFETSSFDHWQGFRYNFKVAAFNEFEMGDEITDQIDILEGSPSVFPSNFKLKTASNLSPTSVMFTWNKVSQHSLNGKFNYYEVWCFVLSHENKTSTTYTTKTEFIIINNLKEDSNYACRVRVWIQKTFSSWSDAIYFKTRDAHFPAPDAIRFIRLSQSTAQITWKWNPDFLIHYSHFIIYYTNEKTFLNKIWLMKSTNTTFTKVILDSLNATISYVIRVSSVSNRGIEGPMSDNIKETSLTSSNWPAKFISELSCAPVSSTIIQLRWFISFQIQYLTHFRVNFSGITKFQSENGAVSLMRDEQEQSALVSNIGDNKTLLSLFSNHKTYYSHQIWKLKPNTRYTIGIEPIFSPNSNMIGVSNHTICSTFKELPSSLETVMLSDINKSSNQIDILLQRPNTENGTIDDYYVVVKVLKEKTRKLRSVNLVDERTIGNLIQNSSFNRNEISNPYIAVSLKDELIFPISTPLKQVHKIKIGENNINGQFKNWKLDPKFYYQFQIIACIRLKESQNTILKCISSRWTTSINIMHTILSKGNKPNFNVDNNVSQNLLRKGPSTFTTTTVVVILGIVILAVLTMSIFLIVKRRRVLKSKLGSVYGSHCNRSLKVYVCRMDTFTSPIGSLRAPKILDEKSICMEHLLKEPLVDSSVRISTSGSLRFKNHGANYLDVNKIQLSSTPDLLVRSSVPQTLGSLVQFHGQHIQNRYLEYAPIPVEALSEHVSLLKENDSKLFNKEYESIEPGQQFTWNCSNMEINRPKNRYANVIAYDHSRVILQPLFDQRNSNFSETPIVSGSDYINANFISGYLNPKAYIATQGPLAETIGDFWRMMWEQNSSVIVMMTRLEERDRTKCDQYWPLGGKGSISTFSYINVTIVDIIELAYYTIRKFHIQKLNDNNVREIFQFQFTAWPDHGVPNHPAPLLMFLRRVHSEISRNCGPIVVHCSAGVGRTGAFIVIDYMLERLRYENTVDIYNYVTNIRSQRNYMVQTEDQYIFIYETLLEAVQCGNTEVPVCELAHHIEKLNQIEINHKTADGIQMTGLQMEFENLVLSSEGFLQGIKPNANNHSHCSTPSTAHANICTNYQPLTYETATQICNQMKNRILQILPPDFSRVNICPIRGVEGSDYINASWIDGYKSRKAYIAAQSPLSETCEDFWRTLWEHNSSIVVMLTQLKENNRERSFQYWPVKRSSRYQFFIVDPVAEYNMTTYIIREFKLTDTRDSQSRVIRQFQFTDWQESESIPHSTQVFLDLINQVHKTKIQLGQDGPIMVHCSAGSGRTGIFLALSNIIERMKNESVIDLFQTVKLLRWQRPALLQTEDQYQFCYVAALEYLKFFEQIRFDL